MSISAISAKKIEELKAHSQLTREIAAKRPIPTEAQSIANLNLALKRAKISPKTGPIPIITLTPASPTSPNGRSYIEFITYPLSIYKEDPWHMVLGFWDANAVDPYILFPFEDAQIGLYFETTPTSTYAIEISVAVAKPRPKALWNVLNVGDNVATDFLVDMQTYQTHTVAFKASGSITKFDLRYVRDWGKDPPGPYDDDPTFYSCKLMLLP